MKEYKTFNQQLGILRERGMRVEKNGKPKRFLEQENYYNVINGYKDLFLERDNNNKPIVPERYKEGTDFEEIKSLFLFDRELRFIFLKYLLVFENSIKTVISHEFSKRYSQKNAYLDITNFDDTDPKRVLQQILILTKTIHEKVDKQGAVKHYIEEHGEVPLWVLVNYLTIGNIAHFYNILTESLKNEISKFYSEKYNRLYGKKIRLSSTDLSSCLKAINLVRNICAHDERLYNANLKRIKLSKLADQFGIDNYDNKRITVVIIYLKAVLDKRDYFDFINDISNILNKYKSKFSTISFDLIMALIGIDEENLEKLKS